MKGLKSRFTVDSSSEREYQGQEEKRSDVCLQVQFAVKLLEQGL